MSSFGGQGRWSDDYAKAAEQAQAEDKLILLDFTGSDWCEYCMKMKHDTLDTSRFRSYAGKNLVLREVDFPHSKPQSEKIKAQNEGLRSKYGISGFPTFILVDKDGKELGRQTGYLAGGPATFIAALGKFYKPAPATATADSTDDFDSFFKKPAGSSAQAGGKKTL